MMNANPYSIVAIVSADNLDAAQAMTGLLFTVELSSDGASVSHYGFRADRPTECNFVTGNTPTVEGYTPSEAQAIWSQIYRDVKLTSSVVNKASHFEAAIAAHDPTLQLSQSETPE